MVVDGVRIGFFGYGYPLVDEPIRCENVHLASIIDIGLMKCDALISRGSRKDFYDLFFISSSIDLVDYSLAKKNIPFFVIFPSWSLKA